jgi:hypothetical protein
MKLRRIVAAIRDGLYCVVMATIFAFALATIFNLMPGGM